MDKVQVKQERFEHFTPPSRPPNRVPLEEVSVIDLGSSDSDSGDDSTNSTSSAGAGINGKRSRVSNGDGGVRSKKKNKSNGDTAFGVALPDGFLDPLPMNGNGSANVQSCKQFWKAGDFDGTTSGDWDSSSGGMDHVRVHPRFLHSNATSHKWVLGAFAELLDNSLDEVCNGATYVNIGMLNNKKDRNRMLLIEDNGGGMDPDKMRQCMSLGYSLKNKVADTIGQYGNGFKTSTMRLGADVIVFSRSSGKNGKRSTQSIGMLSYTFLRSTGKEDIVVPMLDYERGVQEWKKIIRSSAGDWDRNVEAMIRWSPFSSEADLLRQFDQMKDQGTRIIIYNLWEDDQGQLELDFDTDQHDIQIRGVNRDEKSIHMAHQFPNSRHFLTYKHSLRSYASILYLRIPPGFRIILRGKDVQHHNIVNDMMMTKEVTYRPQPGADGVVKDSNMLAVVTMGFVKDARSHIDVQGFNVYHKNRLIKPFWRLWNAAGSDGRGVIGVLEANFVEPAHDKQGFERTIVLSRLESRLIQMQKTYWSMNCHKIGYAPRRNKKDIDERESSPDDYPETSQAKKKRAASNSKIPVSGSTKFSLHKNQMQGGKDSGLSPRAAVDGNGYLYSKGENGRNIPAMSGKGPISLDSSSPVVENIGDDDLQTETADRRANGCLHKAIPVQKSPLKDGSHAVQLPSRQSEMPERRPNGSLQKATSVQRSPLKDGSHTVQLSYTGRSEAGQDCSTGGRAGQIIIRTQSEGHDNGGSECAPSNCSTPSLNQLIEENRELKERLKRKEEEGVLGDLLHDLERERERCQSLEAQLQEATQKIEELNKEQDSLIDIFSEERERRDTEEENLRKKLKDASNTIQELLDKVKLLESMRSPGYKF